jgi:hypothetical protein
VIVFDVGYGSVEIRRSVRLSAQVQIVMWDKMWCETYRNLKTINENKYID